MYSPQITRKRKQHPDLWKQNIRKKLRCHGKPYINSKGKEVAQKKVKTACSEKCFYTCTKNINQASRETINKEFWKLENDQKQIFYMKYIKKKMLNVVVEILKPTRIQEGTLHLIIFLR